MKSYITMGKLIALSFLFCLPLLLFLSINVHTNKMFSRNELARPVMGTIFLVMDIREFYLFFFFLFGRLKLRHFRSLKKQHNLEHAMPINASGEPLFLSQLQRFYLLSGLQMV